MGPWKPALAAIALLANAQGASAAVFAHGATEAGATVIFPTGVVAEPPIELELSADGKPVTRVAAIKLQVRPAMAFAVTLPKQIQVAGRPLAVSGFHAGGPLAGELVVGQHELSVGATFAPDGQLPPGRYVALFDVTLQNN
jgi:hypothetical protein